VSRSRRLRRIFMVVALQDDGSVLLERRPESGVWGGCGAAEFATATAAGAFVRASLRAAAIEPQPLSQVEHAFTHSISRYPAPGALFGRGCRHGGGNGNEPLV